MKLDDQTHVREIDAVADSSVLLQATLLNLNWCEDRFSEQDVWSEPQLAHYALLKPERGDFGFVLVGADGWRCVVWLLFLGAGEPGYGYVGDETPELSICTAPGYRGRGYGRQLLQHALEAARGRGIGAVSLSVETGNPARDLYEQVGFVPVADARYEGTMIFEHDTPSVSPTARQSLSTNQRQLRHR